MSIQNNDIRRYIELLPVAVTWFRMFGASNYANACEVFSLQWAEWLISQNPIVGFLERSFKACSEEYGESAIHTLMTHIREWNFTGPNMKKRWLESTMASECFDFFHMQSSHRVSSTKWYSESGCGDLMKAVCDAFICVCLEVEANTYYPLRSAIGFRDIHDTEYNLDQWETFLEDLQTIGLRSSQSCLRIRQKLCKALSLEALSNVDPDLFF